MGFVYRGKTAIEAEVRDLEEVAAKPADASDVADLDRSNAEPHFHCGRLCTLLIFALNIRHLRP
jgi:hypothetical protein